MNLYKKSYLECVYCGKKSFGGLTHPNCRRKNGIDGVISVFNYKDSMRKAITDMKYSLAYEVGNDLMESLLSLDLEILKLPESIYSQWTIVPIPLHPKRLKMRGFNQADIIGRRLAKEFSFEFKPYLLKREKYTLPQAKIKGKEKRYLNMKNAFNFEHGNEIKNTHILLIDDVVTSGHTFKEATKILKYNGAAKVICFALAS